MTTKSFVMGFMAVFFLNCGLNLMASGVSEGYAGSPYSLSDFKGRLNEAKNDSSLKSDYYDYYAGSPYSLSDFKGRLNEAQKDGTVKLNIMRLLLIHFQILRAD